MRSACPRLLLPLLAALLTAGACALPAVASAVDRAPGAAKIIGGHKVADPAAWPSIVGVLDHGEGPTWNGRFCGGTVVAPQWVLTAAHCVFTGNEFAGYVQLNAGAIDVLYGTHVLSTTSTHTGTRVSVAQVHPNPAYDHVTQASDIALLKLSAPLPGSVPAVAVPGPVLAPLWAAGTTGHIAGWGNTANPPLPAAYPLDLMEVDVPIVSDADCGSIAGYGSSFLPATMICAGDYAHGGIDSCQGDSGGPLTVADPMGRPLLVGDTSWGEGCAYPHKPGIYARVANLRTFVDTTIGWTAGASASPAALTFARPAVDATSATQTVTLDSTGTAPISVAGARLIGADADQFSIVSDSCTQTALLAGQSCAVTVEAHATRDADASAQLVFDRDGLSSAVSVSLRSAVPAPPDPPDPGPDPDPTVTTPIGGTPDPDPPVGLVPAPAPPAVPAVTPPPPFPKPAPARPAAPKVTALRALAPSRGRHRVRMTLRAKGSVTVSFTARVKVGKRLRTVVLATASSTFTAAGTRTVVVRLTRTGRAQLAKHRRLAVRAEVVTRAGTAKATTTRKLTLR